MDGEELGLHGSIGNIPAEDYCVQMLSGKDENQIQISGTMRQSFIFGDKLKLRRKIVSFQEKNMIILEDEIINCGFKEQEYMQLYHCNIGYPFLSPDCELFIPSVSVKGANEFSQENLEKWNMISEPSHIEEMCFLHELKKQGSMNCVGMFNHKWNIGFALRFENHDLDKFLEWRYLNKGEYVIGLEPTTNYAGGKAQERQNSTVKVIAPGESVKHKLEFVFFDSLDEWMRMVEQ